MKNSLYNYIYGTQWSFSDPFTIEIDTRNTKTGSSASNEFLFPQNMDLNDNLINFLVDWGDGQFSRITSKAEATVPHVYANPGIYTLNFYKPKGLNVAISPRYESYAPESNKLLKVIRWGVFDGSRGSFANCANLDLSQVVGSPTFRNIGATGERAFASCTNLTTFKGLSNVIFQGSTTQLFSGCTNFNQSFTLNASTAISSCFVNCTKLNSQITINSSTPSVYDLFRGCTALNTVPVMITPNLVSVEGMFRSCTAFNKDISTMLDWSKITNMQNFMTGKTSANYNPAYYDNLLIALDAGGQSNVILVMGSIKHTSAGLTARNNLLAKGWSIIDGGL